MSDTYFKTNSAFYRIDSVFNCTTKSIFSLNQLGFFSELTQLLYRTDFTSVFLEDRLNYLTEPTWFFTEPTWFFELVFFSLLNKVRAHSRP